jgi:hypothetical protein
MPPSGCIATRPSGYRFAVDDLRPPPAFARTVSTLLIRPETRRRVLAIAAPDRMPEAHLEVVGLHVPAEPGRYRLFLRRGWSCGGDYPMGDLSFVTPRAAARRRSRQLRLSPEALVRAMAASAPEVLASWQPSHGVCGRLKPLACLDLRLLLSWAD